MSRIALLCSEPIRSHMGGIGIRYQELASRLPRPGLDVVLITAGDPAAVPDGTLPRDRIRPFRRGGLREISADCDGAVAQGYLANDLLNECPALPVVIDLYDPFLLENLHYSKTLGIDHYRNDHATWVLQLSRGDFFLCSSEEQRNFYLGFLAALGRVNPKRVDRDPTLTGLIATVPFAIPDELPEHRPLLEAPRASERRILFGGLYDWYDPWTLLHALERFDRIDWTLFFVRNPNPLDTPQRLLTEVKEWCEQRGWLGGRVRIIDWVAAERRFDLLRDVDVLVTTHLPSIETSLSTRTRILEALACGRKVVVSKGGSVSDLIERHRTGWTVPPGDEVALAQVLGPLLDGTIAATTPGGCTEEMLERYSWTRVLEPLLRFCHEPRTDPTKEEFAFRLPTVAPRDSIPARLRRRWERRRRT